MFNPLCFLPVVALVKGLMLDYLQGTIYCALDKSATTTTATKTLSTKPFRAPFELRKSKTTSSYSFIYENLHVLTFLLADHLPSRLFSCADSKQFASLQIRLEKGECNLRESRLPECHGRIPLSSSNSLHMTETQTNNMTSEQDKRSSIFVPQSTCPNKTIGSENSISRHQFGLNQVKA